MPVLLPCLEERSRATLPETLAKFCLLLDSRPAPLCLAACRRAVGDTSVARMQEYAAARGQTLCTLLFGNRSSGNSGGGGSVGGSVGGSSSVEGASSSTSGSTGLAGEGMTEMRDGLAADLALPALPDRKELGLTPRAATAVEAFRQLMAGLHATVSQRPLAQAMEEILARVGGCQRHA